VTFIFAVQWNAIKAYELPAYPVRPRYPSLSLSSPLPLFYFLFFLTFPTYQTLFALMTFLLALMSTTLNHNPTLYAIFSAAIFAVLSIYSIVKLPYPLCFLSLTALFLLLLLYLFSLFLFSLSLIDTCPRNREHFI
jgi:hypothetical protein